MFDSHSNGPSTSPEGEDSILLNHPSQEGHEHPTPEPRPASTAAASVESEVHQGDDPPEVPRGEQRLIALDDLIYDPDIQPRGGLSQATIDQYAELMRDEGNEFPPIEVFRDGDQLKAYAGQHRIAAARKAGKTQIKAMVRSMTRDEARIFAVLDNAKNGLPLTQEEKSKAVDEMLSNPFSKNWSDTRIAKCCGVAPRTVGRHRSQLQSNAVTDTPW